MTDQAIVDHYRTGRSQALLELALMMAEALGSIDEASTDDLLVSDRETDATAAVSTEPRRMGREARELARPLERRLGDSMKQAVTSVIEDELGIVKGVLVARLDAIDEMATALDRLESDISAHAATTAAFAATAAAHAAAVADRAEHAAGTAALETEIAANEARIARIEAEIAALRAEGGAGETTAAAG